jgi:DNA-binding CsgD family transcriptional regulator
MGRTNLNEVLEALGVVAEATTTEELADGVLAAVVVAIGADSALVTDVTPTGLTVRTWPPDFLSVEDQIAFELLNAAEPWPLATHTRRGSERPLRSSDLFTRQGFRDRQIVAELFSHLELDHQVAFSIVIDTDDLLCVAANRKGGDFSDAEIDRLCALHRPLAAVASRLARRSSPSVEAPVGDGCLSPRETEVLSLVATGMTNDQIGRRLGISARTVNKHLEHIFVKTGLANRTEAAGRWRPTGRSPGCD